MDRSAGERGHRNQAGAEKTCFHPLSRKIRQTFVMLKMVRMKAEELCPAFSSQLLFILVDTLRHLLLCPAHGGGNCTLCPSWAFRVLVIRPQHGLRSFIGIGNDDDGTVIWKCSIDGIALWFFYCTQRLLQRRR